jgi:hypothetical protein
MHPWPILGTPFVVVDGTDARVRQSTGASVSTSPCVRIAKIWLSLNHDFFKGASPDKITRKFHFWLLLIYG